MQGNVGKGLKTQNRDITHSTTRLQLETCSPNPRRASEETLTAKG